MVTEFLNRYVSIEKETAYGTEPSGTQTFGEVDDESFSTQFEMLGRSDISRQISSKMVTGTEYSEGGINMATQVDDFFGMLLHGILPDDTVSGSAATSQHVLEAASYGLNKRTSNTALANKGVFDTTVVYAVGDYVIYSDELWRFTSAHSAGAWAPADAYLITYPSFTVRVGRESKEHTYTGMMLNSMNLTANVGEYVMSSFDFVGKSESATSALNTSSVLFDGVALDALHFANGTVKFDNGTDGLGSASAKVKSINLSISMNRDTDNSYGLGSSTYRNAPASQLMEISGTIDFNEVVYTAAAEEPTYDTLITEDGLSFEDPSFDGNSVMQLVFNDMEAAASQLMIRLYHLRFEAPSANVSGRDTATMSVNFTALMNPLLGKAIDIRLIGTGLDDGSGAPAAY
tara:strand:- start:1042 stop:2250 length:1209 start_codon:yes stop_codon:yes gene_type:complete